MLWFLPVSFWYAFLFFFSIFFIRLIINKIRIAPVPLKVGALLELFVLGSGFLAINDVRRAFSALIIGISVRAGMMSFYHDSLALYLFTFCLIIWFVYKKCYLRILNYNDEKYASKNRSLGNIAPLSYNNVKNFVGKSFIPKSLEVQQLRLQEMKIEKNKHVKPAFEKVIGANYRSNQKPLEQLSDEELIALHRRETYPIYSLIAATAIASTSRKSVDSSGRDELDYQMEDFQREMDRSQEEAFHSFHNDHF